jgi:hypothetical protein
MTDGRFAVLGGSSNCAETSSREALVIIQRRRTLAYTDPNTIIFPDASGSLRVRMNTMLEYQVLVQEHFSRSTKIEALPNGLWPNPLASLRRGNWL